MSEAVVLMDGAGVILDHNSAAAELFAVGDGITIIDRHLTFSDNDTTQKYLHALAYLRRMENDRAGTDTRAFAIPRPDGKRPYLLALRRLPRPSDDGAGPPRLQNTVVIVVIRDPVVFADIDADLLRQSYELSPAEVELAVALDRGGAIRDIAERRGVAITTVRTQLYALMSKLDVNRQIDLIRLLRQYRMPF